MDKTNKDAEIGKLKKKYLLDEDELWPFSDFDIVRVKNGEAREEFQAIVTEVPFTIIANDIEIVTLLSLPADLKELCAGFLFTSSFINSPEELISCSIDTKKWIARCELENNPDPEIMRKRLYTSGCGKGVMYAGIDEIALRHPLENKIKIDKSSIADITHWFQRCSDLYRITGGVHSAALSEVGSIPQAFMDDVGRHNAVDKIIGWGLLKKIDFSKMILITSGRTSSEILLKAKRCGIAVTISRGAPTHQTILRAREMKITVIGFARAGGFVIYSEKERINI